MENPVCNFKIIQNPNRKYANTVNLVFFRAVPLTKNFQKYIDGLSEWKTYMKDFPGCQLQIFVDEHVLKDEKIVTLLKELQARVILFECPDYLIEDKFHIGLFATMIRFYPMFDINTHPLKVAHIQELEPEKEFLYTFKKFDKLASMNHGASMVYITNKLYSKEFVSNKYKFEDFIYYPWIIAGRFSVYDKVPFELFTKYLEDVNNNKQFFNIYKDWEHIKKEEHKNYSFGVDEIFLNDIYLGYLIKQNMTIGIYSKYKIAYPVYYLKDQVKANPKSKPIFEYILNKKGSLKELMNYFDELFNSKTETDELIQSSKRFYEVVEKHPDWLGTYASKIILKFFKGYIYRSCLFLIKNNKVIDIKDLN